MCYLYQQDGDWNAKSFFAQAAPKPIRQRSEYGFTARVPGHPEHALRVRQRRSHEVWTARTPIAKRLLHAGGARGAAADARQRHAGRTARGSSRSWTASRRFTTTIPQHPDDARGIADQPAGRGLLRPAGLERRARQHPHRPLSVDAADPRIRGRHHRRAGAPEEQAAEPGHHVDARDGLDASSAKRATASGVRSTNVDIADGNDTPIIRFTASPVAGSTIGNAGNFPIHRDQTDHQFVYNLTAQAFRTPLVQGGHRISAASSSTTSPTTIRAVSGRSTPAAAA